MEIIETLESNIAEVRVIGDLDANSSIDLDAYFKRQFKSEMYCFYINCEELRYISSAGLGVFISHLEFLNQQNGKFVFYNMNNLVFDTFKILGLHEIMNIAENRESAKLIMNEG
jgi:anti-sigma B factor antagonist